MPDSGTVEPWYRRWFLAPISAQLTQGVTPDRLALTIALGLMLGIFPILGSTTLLCGAAGVWLKLNQPIIQLLNYIAYPVQITLLIPFYRAGESLFGRDHLPLSISLLIQRFAEDWWQFLRDFGGVALHGIVVWMIVAPLGTAFI
ncbi:MAG: DUF2062 domain-containing protein, partial [Chthoniobacteraceae bacterium]